MMVSTNFLETLVILFLYMFIYNTSLFLFLWTLQQFVSFNFKTIFSFNDLKFNFFFTTLVSIVLFSIAGVPPFLGFFSKLFILTALINSHFFFFYIFFFVLLFFGLYFYVQNIRFLYSTGLGKIEYAFVDNVRVTPIYYYFSYLILFVLIFGIFFIDDFILYFYWLLS